jgi:hypothetical protein
MSASSGVLPDGASCSVPRSFADSTLIPPEGASAITPLAPTPDSKLMVRRVLVG